MIKVEKMLEVMQRRFTNGQRRPFRCVFVKANLRTGVAGEVVELEAVTCEWVDHKKRIVRLKTNRYDHPIPIHYDLIINFQNEDVA